MLAHLKNLAPEKALVSVSKIFGAGKEYRYRYRFTFWVPSHTAADPRLLFFFLFFLLPKDISCRLFDNFISTDKLNESPWVKWGHFRPLSSKVCFPGTYGLLHLFTKLILTKFDENFFWKFSKLVSCDYCSTTFQKQYIFPSAPISFSTFGKFTFIYFAMFLHKENIDILIW